MGGAMIKKGFAAGFPLGRYYKGMEQYMVVAVTEKRTREEILKYAQALKDVLRGGGVTPPLHLGVPGSKED